MKSPLTKLASRRGRTVAAAVIALTASALALSGCASAAQSDTGSSSSFKEAKQDPSSTITVWTDSTRLPDVQKYQKENPNVKMNIVTFDGSADGSTYLQTKMQLFDRTGKGWPDVVFASPTDVTWASVASSPSAQPYAAPVDQLVPKSTLSNFAQGSLTPCQVDGHTYCLRNDIAQVVLWYNKKLMDQWGYQVPTTWEQYQALGEKVAQQHPGYVIGAVGDTNSQESYFWSSRCPAQQLTGKNTLKVDLSSPDCTRMAKLLDPLIADKSVSTQGFFTQGFNGSKVLMSVGPSWQGQYLYNSAFKTPAGQIAAAAPLKWAGESQTYTGNVGGGIWMISSHSKNLKAATKVAEWLTTSNENLSDAPTYPAYVPGAKAWLANPANKDYFADDVSQVFLDAANEVWTGWSNTKFSDATPWSNTVLPALTAGKSMSEILPEWQTAIVNEAKSVGYTVTTK
ncbi:ABC transporter substrate-binding protein [Gryllotalpicola reticulitermitis]|uniref:ABC transporter substrate-binding protein n=1 Tax=Gryllotalpicola reticulitermitis TaxID=1184153 RepID=A0ABV8QCZ0_9MICO